MGGRRSGVLLRMVIWTLLNFSPKREPMSLPKVTKAVTMMCKLMFTIQADRQHAAEYGYLDVVEFLVKNEAANVRYSVHSGEIAL